MHQHGVNPAGPDLSYGQPPNQNPQAQPEAAPVKPKEGSFKISDKVFIGIILILAVIVAILGVAKLSNKSTKGKQERYRKLASLQSKNVLNISSWTGSQGLWWVFHNFWL